MKFLAFIASLFIRTLHAMVRVRHVHAANLERLPQYILTFWHSHLLLMLHSRFRRPISTMISRSKDGEIIARVFDWYGVHSARGSSTRGGGIALRALIREAREGKNSAFTPDGPKGPPRIVKEGVIQAARATSLPIVPIAFAAKKKSFSARGIGWWSRSRSRERSSSTASRSSCRAMETSMSGVPRSSNA